MYWRSLTHSTSQCAATIIVKASESHRMRGPVHHWLRWLEKTLNEYSFGLKAVYNMRQRHQMHLTTGQCQVIMPGEGEGKIRETKEPDECRRCESTQKSQMSAANVSQPQRAVYVYKHNPVSQCELL